MDNRTRRIADLFCATSDGTPEQLRDCIDRGCPWDRPLPRAPSRTLPINIAAQYQRHDNLAILATKALEEGRPELLESPDLKGRSPAYLAVQKGNPMCLGVMAKAGANLHRACPHVWQLPGSESLVDPDKHLRVHHALNQTVVSFTTATCLSCHKNALDSPLKVCQQCKMAYFCGAECQREKWPEHKKVCKKIRMGADLITFHDTMPRQPPVDEGGFLPFVDEIDNDLGLDPGELEEDYYDASKQWEYYDLWTKTWKPYPKDINRSIEDMHEMGMSPRYMYKPGNKDAEGFEERELTANPPSTVATNHVYYAHMIDHHIYTGCGRRIRRRVLSADEL